MQRVVRTGDVDEHSRSLERQQLLPLLSVASTIVVLDRPLVLRRLGRLDKDDSSVRSFFLVFFLVFFDDVVHLVSRALVLRRRRVGSSLLLLLG